VFLVWDEEDGADIVKVVDFGIAKFTERTSEAAGTYTGSLLGTPFYMSPEQARGLRTVDHRSDLWSLGVIAFRCVVGRLPFEGESVGDVLVQLCTGPIPVPSEIVPDLPPGFDAWMARVLSRDTSARFSSAAELADSLAAVCGVPMRPGYSTGDIPILSSDDGGAAASSPDPVVTPSYPNTRVPSDPTLASRLVGVARTGPSVSIGGGLTNTPALPVRRSRTSMVLMLVVVLGGSAVALVTSRKTTGSTTAAEKPPPRPPLPFASAAPPAVATATESVQVRAERPKEGAASASTTASALPPAQRKVPKRSPAAASSSRVAPSLDIRLQR